MFYSCERSRRLWKLICFCIEAALESRYCLQSNERLKPELSQSDILSCDNQNKKCQGATFLHTLKYLENNGTCDFACKPYQSKYEYIFPYVISNVISGGEIIINGELNLVLLKFSPVMNKSKQIFTITDLYLHLILLSKTLKLIKVEFMYIQLENELIFML